MNITKYAKQELARIEHDEEGMQERMNRCILEIIEMFGEQGHSNLSANYAIEILNRLLRYLPITPLTGDEEEWEEIVPGKFQNKRCSRVFKENGEAYDIEGRVFSYNDGITWFQNRNSRVPVTFPYFPPIEPEYVYVGGSDDR